MEGCGSAGMCRAWEPKVEYFQGQGDLVSRLITLIETHIVTLIIPIIHTLTKSP